MPAVTTMNELMIMLRAGWTVVQQFRPRFSGDSPRDLFHLQQGEHRRAVSQRLIVTAMRRQRLQPESVGAGAPPTWRLKTRSTPSTQPGTTT